METKPVETGNKSEGDEQQLSPTKPALQQQQQENVRRSPLGFLKKRVKSGSSKKRRDSGNSEGDIEPVVTIEEELSDNKVLASPSNSASRRLSLDSAPSSSQPVHPPLNSSSKEKPRQYRGIAKVFHDLKYRSRIRKSHSAPPSGMDSNQVSSPVSVVADDDSFSSYATAMGAHSSGYSTPLMSSNVGSPESSMTESFVEEDEEQADVTTTTMEESLSPAQVAAVQLASPPSAPASPHPAKMASETLAEPSPKASSLETEPVDVDETLANSSSTNNNNKPECHQQEEATPVSTVVSSASADTSSSPSLAVSRPAEATTLTTSSSGSAAGQRSRIPLLSQHRSSVPCTSTSQETTEALKVQQPERSSSTSEFRFCFSEYNGTKSPTKGLIRSPDSSKMDTANNTAGTDANGYPKNEHLYKVLVIGELGTGKTSIIKRYVHQFFSQHYRATIGVDFALKVVHWDQSTVIRLQLWDIAGQERFGNMTRVYYKEAVGAFIVFDVTRSSTFESVAKWKQDLDTKVQLPDGSPIPCVLLANKCDQPKEGIAASPAKMDEYCREKGFAGWFETSAKDNINIDDAAKFLVGTILQNDQWSTSIKEEDADKLDLNGKGGTAGGDKKSNCC
ncbi:ras and EF-hand domain-containing protein homolog isoform X2 [Daphnia pulex]|uniref:ras and EF-hand domain-containing protein homolog isoform X2 n=1 Tax=Daphnia pulex TaxID=6669 RepID=UPI001EDD9103|nr:ras and EF-hand domain-containing protein homolog isoform X2 [Daphnia pulex]XP_046447467.1 ras and EF-hand domain-containing protein homolog isoform X2 [Daphnia pulex]